MFVFSFLLILNACVNSENGAVDEPKKVDFFDLSTLPHHKEGYKVYGRTGEFYTTDGATANYYLSLIHI